MKEPTFSERKQLARYIDEVSRHKDNRPAAAAFIDLAEDDPTGHHLSVNSLEVEPARKIAAYHRARVNPTDGKVALCIHNIDVYNEAAQEAGIAIKYNRNLTSWEFIGLKGNSEPAYKHRPLVRSDMENKSPSHCGVEYARMMNRNTAQKFARRLTKHKFQILRKST